MFTSTYKNIKKLTIEIFKHTISGKLDMEEAPCMEGCVNPNIQEKQKITPKTLPVDYSYMLLTITNRIKGKKSMLSYQQ